MDDQVKCLCKVTASQDEHSCPYQIDVNNDHEFVCSCCVYCEQRCKDDV